MTTRHFVFLPLVAQVLDMGVVKEVVTALERSPVSAKDLKDLKVSLGERAGENTTGKPSRVGIV